MALSCDSEHKKLNKTWFIHSCLWYHLRISSTASRIITNAIPTTRVGMRTSVTKLERVKKSLSLEGVQSRLDEIPVVAIVAVQELFFSEFW